MNSFQIGIVIEAQGMTGRPKMVSFIIMLGAKLCERELYSSSVCTHVYGSLIETL